MGNCCEKKKKSGSEEAARAKGAGTGDFFKKLGAKKRRSSADTPSAAHYVEDKNDFAAQLKDAGDKLVVVDFYAGWCGPCQTVKPKVEELATQMKTENVIFLKVNVDTCEEVTADYGVSSMPTFVLIKDSKKVDEMSGVNMDRLKELIVSHKAPGKAE